MNLLIKDRYVSEPIINIINKLRNDTNYRYFRDIQIKNKYLRVTCPFHKDGKEQHPSCSIFYDYNDEVIIPGTVHCFTCGKKMNLVNLVSYCLNLSKEQAEEWILDNFENNKFTEVQLLPEITFAKNVNACYMDESVLDNYKYIHPYALQRGLTEDIIKKFKIGYNFETNSITFPVWDPGGQLVGITERNVDKKIFYIPKNITKPIYLLNYIIKENITKVWCCESQINCLLCWQYGHPAIGLFGTGSEENYSVLKKSGIRHYVLCFDGDDAGKKGIKRFIENMPEDVMISVVKMYKGKDVGDLTEEEFRKLEIVDKNDWKF